LAVKVRKTGGEQEKYGENGDGGKKENSAGGVSLGIGHWSEKHGGVTLRGGILRNSRGRERSNAKPHSERDGLSQTRRG